MGDFPALVEALAELQRLATVPWDQLPNRAPCTSWRTCGRSYELIEYDEAETEIRRSLVMEIGASGVMWLSDTDDSSYQAERKR